ncbi:MAG TPA: hypothetical protein VIP11_08595 [Gemmatimonadaceae bacterium]
MRRWPMLRTMKSRWAVSAAFAVVVVACGGGSKEPPPLRQNSMSYAFIIKPDDSPPHARQDINYTIQVFDSKTRQPIENGEGQLFASKPIDPDAPSGPHTKTWDGMASGPGIGIYRAKLNYVIAGQWAMAIRFRRDSLHPLERIDWMQDVLDERQTPTPTPTSNQPAPKVP